MKFSSWGGEDKKVERARLCKNLIKFVFSLLGVILFGYALMKVYEVPVYYTKIDMVYSGCAVDDLGNMNIKICRNYDRSDKSSIIPDSIFGIRHNDPSGIYICSLFNNDHYGHNERHERIDAIRKTAEAAMAKHGNIKKYTRMAYISVQSSYRQNFIPVIRRNQEYLDSGVNETLNCNFFDNIFFIKDVINIAKSYNLKDYTRYYKKTADKNGIIYSSCIMASEEDEKIPFYMGFTNKDFVKPSVIYTAEDISKIVEVIEIGHSKREIDTYAGAWAFTNSLTIDYVGPSEFSEHIKPEPDEITMSSIRYTDKKKIEQIGRHGLRYHVRFPDMENIQEARIFILSGILTGAGALCLRYLWRILCGLFLIFKDYFSRYQRFKRVAIIAFSLIIISLIIYAYYIAADSNVDPFDLQNKMMNISETN